MPVPFTDGSAAPRKPGEEASPIIGFGLALLLGFAGLGINVFLPFNISWGVHLLFGGCIALVGVRLLPPALALGAVLLATLPSFLLWVHWFAVAIMCCEAAWLCMAGRRGWPLAGADLAYWLAVGCPASIVVSLAWGGATPEVALLVAAKLGLNGVANASVADILHLASLRWPLLRRIPAMRGASARSALVSILAFFVAVPGLAASSAFSLLSVRGIEREMTRELGDYAFDIAAAHAQVVALAAGSLGNFAPRIARQLEANPGGARAVALAGPVPWETIVLLDASGPATDPPEARCWAATLRSRLAGAGMAEDMVVSVPAKGPCEASLLVVRQLAAGRLAVLRASSATMARQTIEAASRRLVRDGRGWLAGAFDEQDQLVAMAGNIDATLDRSPPSRGPADTVILPTRDLGYFKRDLQDWGARTTLELPAIPGWRIGVAISSSPLRAEAQWAQAAILAVALMLVAGVVVAGSAIASAVGRRLRFSAARSGRPVDDAPRLPLQEMDLLDDWIRGMVEQLRTERWTSDAFRARLEAFEAMAPIITYVAEDAPGEGSPVITYSSSIRRVLDVDPAAAVASGWARASIHPDDWARVQATFSSGIDSSGMARETYRLRGSDGRYRWFMDTRVRLPGGGGSRVLHGLMLEVTDQKEAEHQLVQAAKLAQIGELAVSMGHELSQPLNVIKLSASNLQAANEAGPIPREQLAVRLDRISRQVEKASSLLSHLKVFGRQASEQPFAPFHLARLVDDALLVLRGTLSHAGIEVALDIREPDPVAHGQGILVEQALVNLVANAASAIEERREREPHLAGRIVISVRADGPMLRISVADNGGGVPDDARDRIFEPFFTTKPPGKGTGLGLSISRRALQEMGGGLCFANEGEGAVFTMSVPRA
ncbi:MAG: PAS domain-containing protein [Gemmatimonadetes bacterium]|nr:PAS domain-containing protein [Gemmatimonadota bacterium]